MNRTEIFEESGVKPSPSSLGSGKMSDEEAPGVGLVNVRVLGGRDFCKKVAAALEPLGLITTGFEPDPHGTPNVFRMFLAGRGE